jgi:hypothetical protein
MRITCELFKTYGQVRLVEIETEAEKITTCELRKFIKDNFPDWQLLAWW